MGLAALVLLMGTASAQEAAFEPVGLPIAEVTLIAPEGGLPEESLQPLLRAHQGDILSPTLVRTDLATLYRVGNFAAVEADADPWFLYDDAGELIPAVSLSYRVYPAPRLDSLTVQGSPLATNDVLSAVNLEVGGVFYPDLELDRIQERVVELHARRGYPDALVELDPQVLPSGDVELWVRIDPGQPRTIATVVLAGDLVVSERKLRKVLARAGVKEGEPLGPEAIQEAQIELRRYLANGARGRLNRVLTPFNPTRWFAHEQAVGWVQARTGAAVSSTPDGVAVTFTIEAGPQLMLLVEGLAFRGPSKVNTALGIDERLRLTRGFVDAAPERIVSDLQERGYLLAEASARLVTDGEDKQQLRVDVTKGPAHSLRDPLFARGDSDLHGLRFSGNQQVEDWELRTVMQQASYDVLRLDHITRPELDRAISAAEDYYRSQGYAEASISAEPFITMERPSLLKLPGIRQAAFRFRGAETQPPRWVQVDLRVSEGPQSTLADLGVLGVAPDVDVAFLDEVVPELRGGPWSPQRLERLARELIEAHRDAGYLEADARVVSRRVGPQSYTADIAVEPGPQVLLRSMVTRGAHHTRPSFIQRELPLELGQPISTADLEQVRSNLYDTGVFQSVSTELLGDESARDLVVTVEERSRNAAEVGAGLSSDMGARVFARYTRRNLWGVGHRADLNAFGGAVGLSPDDLEFRAAGSWTAVRFPGRHSQLVVDALFQERLQFWTHELARTGAGTFIDSRFGRASQLRLGVRLEGRRLIETDPGIVLPGEPWAKILADDSRTWRPQHTVNALYVHDLRDDPLTPTEGVLASLRGEWSPNLTPANDAAISFVRSDLRVSGYVPLGSGITLQLSAAGGIARTLTGAPMPLEDRYRVGGTVSMRGYRRDTVGPRNQVEQVDIDWPSALQPAVDDLYADQPYRWVPVGGDTMATATAELIMPLPTLGLSGWDGYAAALFVDAGNVWLLQPSTRATSDTPEWKDVWDPVLRVGAGVGLRIETPIGPLQADLAANPHVLFASSPEARDLLINQWGEPAARLHLSIGTLF